jgi:hypothetical protein
MRDEHLRRIAGIEAAIQPRYWSRGCGNLGLEVAYRCRPAYLKNTR